MPIAVKCEKCGKGLKAPDTVAGKRVKCPGCGAPISVPAPAAARAPAVNILDGLGEDDLLSGGGLGDLDKLSQAVGKSLPAAGASRGHDPLGPTPVSQGAPKKDRRRMIIIGGSIGGTVLAVLLIVVVILMFQGDSPPDNIAAATPDVAQPATTPVTQAPAAAAASKPAGSGEDLSALFDSPQAPVATSASAAAPAQSPAAVGAAPTQPVAPAQPSAPPAQLASATPVPVVPAKVPAPVVNPPAPVQNPAGVPLDPQQKALLEKAAREQAKISRQSYLALLSGDPQTLVEQMRWAPAAKRPIFSLRWGVSLPVPQLAKAGRPQPPKAADSEGAIVQAIGPPGTKLLSGLNERITHGDFGGPSGPSSGSPSQITVLPGDDRGEVLAAARERGVDIVILIDLKFQAAIKRKKKGAKGAGGPPKMSVTLSSRIVDVASGTPGWSSDSISNKNAAAAEKDAVEWAGDNLQQIDEFKLQPVPELEAKDVEKRMTDLEKKKLANPLAALLEVRYYQIKGIVPAERATAFFTQVLGENGNLLASDDGKERQKALEKLAKP